MGCLGYTTWRRFKDAINRAMESCKSAEIEVSDHFADAVKMVEIGSNRMFIDGSYKTEYLLFSYLIRASVDTLYLLGDKYESIIVAVGRECKYSFSL